MILIALAAACGGTILIVMLEFFSTWQYRSQFRFWDYFPRAQVRSQRRIFRAFLHWADQIEPPSFLSILVKAADYQLAGLRVGWRQALSGWWMMILISYLGCTLLLLINPDTWQAILIVLCCSLFVFLFPPTVINQLKKNRRKKLENSLPYFLDMLALSLEAGLGFLPALKRVQSGTPDPLKSEIQYLIDCYAQGFTKRAALERLIARNPYEDIIQFTQAVLLADRLGTSLARTMRIQANLFRARRKRQAEVRAKTAPIRIIPALVLFFLPALLLIYLAPPILSFLNVR